MSMEKRILELMKNENMTQKELASKINVTEASMSRYLKGERTPRIDVLANIARVFDVSIEFIRGEEEKSEFNEIKSLITRNASSMTLEQKMELTKILLQD